MIRAALLVMLAVGGWFSYNSVPGNVKRTVYVTGYGYHDNDPPGTDITLPILHKKAGGVGTFKDPITFAADPRHFKKGTIIYVPALMKYFIMEDECATAVRRPINKTPLIDLWVGGRKTSDKKALTTAEERITNAKLFVIEQPSSNFHVDPTPLFAD